MIDMTTDQNIRLEAVRIVASRTSMDEPIDFGFLVAQAAVVAKYIMKGVDGENVIGIPADHLEEMDRNARAYGWEVGHGQTLASRIEHISEENPFQDPEWRHRVFLSENRSDLEYVEVPQPEPEGDIPETESEWIEVPESHSEPETEHGA